MRVITAILAFLFSLASHTPSPHYERLLLPINDEQTHGAFGSLWVTEIWLHNGSDQPIAVLPSLVADLFIVPGETVMLPLWPKAAGSPPGAFIWIGTNQPERIHLNLRVRDISREAENAGTELPVVREREFRSDRIVLLYIPADLRFRRTLRLYESLVLGQHGGDVIVRIFSIPDNELLWERLVTLEGVSSLGYAEVPINTQFQGHGAARVEIEPLRQGMKIWAFISITNDDTQHVTIITPQ
jgi:hypothetical protein